MAIEADSCDPGAIRAAAAHTIERFGRLDVAVVNAGVLRLGTIEELSLEDLDLTLAVNVRGVFLAIQAAAAGMQDGGRVITIGSNTAERVARGSSIYAMSKAAVATVVKGIALDLAPRGITVNNIQPGPTETDMTASMVCDLAAMVRIGRVGQGAEIAELALYLAGPRSGYMTGSNLTIDGASRFDRRRPLEGMFPQVSRRPENNSVAGHRSRPSSPSSGRQSHQPAVQIGGATSVERIADHCAGATEPKRLSSFVAVTGSL